jgi:hypothetical protein
MTTKTKPVRGSTALELRFNKLALLEPRLLTLREEISKARPSVRDWYTQGWKQRVVKLVGWERTAEGSDRDEKNDAIEETLHKPGEFWIDFEALCNAEFIPADGPEELTTPEAYDTVYEICFGYCK